MKWLNKGLAQWHMNMTKEQEQAFIAYRQLILDWNKKMNLTAITEEKDMEIKHFLDSLSPLLLPELDRVKLVLDLGTGAGFPGIPLKIMRPQWRMVLMDSLNKRIRFLEAVVEELGLEEVKCIHGRAEEYGHLPAHREKYDLVISRAVAPLATLTEYCLPFVRKGGYFLAMKGSAAQDELKMAKGAITMLGGETLSITPIKMVGLDWEPQLILIKKRQYTPKAYPRSGGKPRTKPLT